MADERTYAPNQECAKVTLNKKMLVLDAKLKPTNTQNFTKIHSGRAKEKTSSGGSLVSVIGIKLIDYSNGTGDKAVSVTHNIKPEDVDTLLNAATGIMNNNSEAINEAIKVIAMNQSSTEQKLNNVIRMLTHLANAGKESTPEKKEKLKKLTENTVCIPDVIAMGMNDYEFPAELKIVGSVKDPETGLSPVSKLIIKRVEFYNGAKSKRPWFISVETGSAMAQKTSTGGTQMASGSYKKNTAVNINLTDDEFINALRCAKRYITVWEITEGAKLVREGSRKRMEAFQQNQN